MDVLLPISAQTPITVKLGWLSISFIFHFTYLATHPPSYPPNCTKMDLNVQATK